MKERKALRRVAAILFHRRAGFSANGMGVWNVPEERIMEIAPLMASYRGISHCYQRPDLRGLALLGLHDGPRPLEGGVRRHPRLDRRGDRDRGPADALLARPSSRRSGSSTSPTSTSGGKLNTPRSAGAVRARRRADARRRQLAGAGHGLDRPRPDLRSPRGAGAELTDVDGNAYIDWMLLVGAADRRPRPPGGDRGGDRRRRARHQLRRHHRGRGRAGRARWSDRVPVARRWCAWSTPAPRRR